MKGSYENKLIAIAFSALFVVASGFFSSASVPVFEDWQMRVQHFSSTTWLMAFIVLAIAFMVVLLLARFNVLSQKTRSNSRQSH